MRVRVCVYVCEYVHVCVFVFACALLLLAQSLYATPVFVVVWVCGFVWVHVCVCV